VITSHAAVGNKTPTVRIIVEWYYLLFSRACVCACNRAALISLFVLYFQRPMVCMERTEREEAIGEVGEGVHLDGEQLACVLVVVPPPSQAGV
jgi:hypothetical protein